VLENPSSPRLLFAKPHTLSNFRSQPESRLFRIFACQANLK
jgi:hypothetical protein